MWFSNVFHGSVLRGKARQGIGYCKVRTIFKNIKYILITYDKIF